MTATAALETPAPSEEVAAEEAAAAAQRELADALADAGATFRLHFSYQVCPRHLHFFESSRIYLISSMYPFATTLEYGSSWPAHACPWQNVPPFGK